MLDRDQNIPPVIFYEYKGDGQFKVGNAMQLVPAHLVN